MCTRCSWMAMGHLFVCPVTSFLLRASIWNLGMGFEYIYRCSGKVSQYWWINVLSIYVMRFILKNIDCFTGNRCTYAYAYFSIDSSNYALSCSGPDPLFITIMNANHKRIFNWEENRPLRQKLATRTQPIFRNFYVTVNGYKNKVKLSLPPDFDEKKSYPLLINV